MKQVATSKSLETDVGLLRNKQDVLVKQGHDDMFMHFPKS